MREIRLLQANNPEHESFRAATENLTLPMLVTGAMENWPARERWSLDYIADRNGDRPIPIEYYGKGGWFTPFTYVQMPMHEYVRHVRSGGDSTYYLVTELREAFPNLVDEVAVPNFIDTTDIVARTRQWTMFAGHETLTGMHYHQLDQAVLCQIRGTKRVLLYAPWQTRHVKPRPWYRKSNYSTIEHKGSHDMWEAFATNGGCPPPIDLTLHAGEMLFIPIHWWHVAGGLGESVSLTFFWRARLNEWFFPTPGITVMARKASQKPLGAAVRAAKAVRSLTGRRPRPYGTA